MARTALHLLLCACLLTISLTSRPASAGNDPDQRQRNLLAVQVALEKGLAALKRGDYATAVAVLEKHVAHIDGNRQYLNALRDAYIGHVAELEKAGKQAEAKRYRGFLEILDPGARGGTRTTPVVKKNVAPPAAPVAITPRAKVEEDDPFAENNSAVRRARNYLDQADREFDDRHYEEAARHYAQAECYQPGCTKASRERWAYCQLFTIAQSINSGTNLAAPEDMRRQVKQAVEMAPRLERFGQSLLDRLRDFGRDAGPRLEVKHTARQGNGWAVAETASFRIFHTGSEADGEKLARIVESTRLAMSRKWLGEEAQVWSPRCDIYIHATAQAYSKATGAPAAAPGHSTISLDGARVVARRIDLRADNPNLLDNELPHETTHVVLAGQFGKHHVPRWADEGMAVLTEPQNRIELHLRNLATYHREGMLFRVSELMQTDNYPEPRRIGAFYAQSVSLVNFLCKKKDPLTFTRFLRAALDGKYEPALQTYFGYNSFAELEQDWKQHALGDAAVASTSKKLKR